MSKMRSSLYIRTRAIVLAVILMSVSTLAFAQVRHKVSVGGADIVLVPPGTDANFSLTAIERADGTITGQYQDVFGAGLQPGVHAQVTCLSVSGNQAWVSGVVTHTPPALDFLLGFGVGTRLEDNGTSANDTPDRLSFSIFFVDPNICSLQLGDAIFPLFDVNNGQIKIR